MVKRQSHHRQWRDGPWWSAIHRERSALESQWRHPPIRKTTIDLTSLAKTCNNIWKFWEKCKLLIFWKQCFAISKKIHKVPFTLLWWNCRNGFWLGLCLKTATKKIPNKICDHCIGGKYFGWKSGRMTSFADDVTCVREEKSSKDVISFFVSKHTRHKSAHAEHLTDLLASVVGKLRFKNNKLISYSPRVLQGFPSRSTFNE